MKNLFALMLDIGIGLAATFVAGYIYGDLHTAWYYGLDDHGPSWIGEALYRGDIDMLQPVFANGCYVLTGFITGGLAGLGRQEKRQQWTRFVFGPGLMYALWLHFYTNSPLMASLVFVPVAVATFMGSTRLWVRLWPRHNEEEPGPGAMHGAE